MAIAAKPERQTLFTVIDGTVIGTSAPAPPPGGR